MKSVYVVLFLTILIVASAATTFDAGFGCPYNQMDCRIHCRSVGYYRGYCTNFFKHTCKCY